jgi:hypothetical protein
MDNQEKTEGAIKNGRFRKPGNTWYTKDEDKHIVKIILVHYLNHIFCFLSKYIYLF